MNADSTLRGQYIDHTEKIVCHPIRILHVHSCREDNAAFNSVIGGPAITLQRA